MLIKSCTTTTTTSSSSSGRRRIGATSTAATTCLGDLIGDQDWNAEHVSNVPDMQHTTRDWE